MIDKTLAHYKILDKLGAGAWEKFFGLKDK
jgi:hypothetical protein